MTRGIQPLGIYQGYCPNQTTKIKFIHNVKIGKYKVLISRENGELHFLENRLF
jgi:hypothetical protein